MHPVTPFALLEADKENIQPIPQGRSALKLAALTATDPENLSKQLHEDRAIFEKNLLPEKLKELDDPLDAYLEYIKWIRENYRTGNNKESKLIQVLERTTHDFKDDQYYKNEVRYFKLWLEYITYSDNPGDVYSYLHKKQIGSKLALFYEHYALYFEAIDQWDKADEILQLGLSNNARPVARLNKTYTTFLNRKEAHEKAIPISSQQQGLTNKGGQGLSTLTATQKRKYSKMEIFQDTEPHHQITALSNFSLHSNENIPHLDSIVNAKKENNIQPSSWDGQTLKSTALSNPMVKKAKLQVFDDKSLQYPITKSVSHPDGESVDTFDFNADLFLPNSNSLTEVLLMFFKPLESTLTVPSSEVYHTPSQKSTKADCNMQPDTPLVEYFKTSKKLFSNENEKEYENGQPQESNNINLMANLLLPSNEVQLPDTIGGGFSDIFQDTITKTFEKVESTVDAQVQTVRKTNDDLLSSPFVENPNLVNFLPEILDPSDIKTTAYINDAIQSLLYNKHNFHNLSSINFDKLHSLQTILTSNHPPIYGNKQTMVEFESANLFCFTKELARTEESVVYLSEKMDGQLNSIIVSAPPNQWEALIIKRLNEKSKDFIKCFAFYNYMDESYLLLPYFKQGNVLNLVKVLSNHLSITSKNLLEETLVIYFTIQLLTNIIKLHSIGFIHCNINPSSCMINIDIPSNKLTFNDVILTDFSKSIDCSLFPPNTKFQASYDNKPWSYERDYFGVANVIHTLLFGLELKVIDKSEGLLLTESIKKYWQRDLWNELFRILLNPVGDMKADLEKVKGKFESWFSLTVDKRIFISRLRNVADILESKKS